MKRIFYFFSLLFISFNVLAGDITGGSLGNLIPAPKITKGTIWHGVYTWKISDTPYKFSIAIPQAIDAYEYSYTHIKEQNDASMSYVSFGPAASNQNIYRVVIVKKLDNTPLKVRTKNAASFITDSLVKAHGLTFKGLFLSPTKFRGHKAFITASQLTNVQVTMFNVNLVSDYGKYILIFSVDIFPSPGKSIEHIKQSILQGKLEELRNFTRTFSTST